MKINKASYFKDFKAFTLENFDWVTKDSVKTDPFVRFKDYNQTKRDGLREEIITSFERLPKAQNDLDNFPLMSSLAENTDTPNRMNALLFIERLVAEKTGQRNGIKSVYLEIKSKLTPIGIAKYEKKLFAMQAGVDFLVSLRTSLRNKPILSFLGFLAIGTFMLTSTKPQHMANENV